jgi:hypothetical protein
VPDACVRDQGGRTCEEYALEELTFLGIASSTAFEREPEGNGCVGAAATRPRGRQSEAARATPGGGMSH